MAVLAELSRELPDVYLSAWAEVLERHPAPALALIARLAEARPGYALEAKAARLIRAWSEAVPGPSGAAIALALRTGAHIHRDHAARRTDVVASGPSAGDGLVRLTEPIITDIIRQSRASLLVVSFAAFGVAQVVRELTEAAARGVRLDLVLESVASEGGTLHGTDAAAPFAALRARATFWTWPARHRPGPDSSRPALHAKVVAADDRVALVGSANLTDRALSRNLELGVLIRDPDTVHRLTAHFRALMAPGQGPLEPWRSE